MRRARIYVAEGLRLLAHVLKALLVQPGRDLVNANLTGLYAVLAIAAVVVVAVWQYTVESAARGWPTVPRTLRELSERSRATVEGAIDRMRSLVLDTPFSEWRIPSVVLDVLGVILIIAAGLYAAYHVAGWTHDGLRRLADWIDPRQRVSSRPG